ncbi:hypothetical protein ACLOJK_011973 [Asimina triloba]
MAVAAEGRSIDGVASGEAWLQQQRGRTAATNPSSRSASDGLAAGDATSDDRLFHGRSSNPTQSFKLPASSFQIHQIRRPLPYPRRDPAASATPMADDRRAIAAASSFGQRRHSHDQPMVDGTTTMDDNDKSRSRQHLHAIRSAGGPRPIFIPPIDSSIHLPNHQPSMAYPI